MPDNKKLTPADYDRWETTPGTTYPIEEQPKEEETEEEEDEK